MCIVLEVLEVLAESLDSPEILDQFWVVTPF